MLHGFVYDIESNGFLFESTKVWTICLRDLETDEKLRINPFKEDDAKEKFLAWLDKYDCPIVTGHYILGFDQFVLNSLLGISFKVGKPDEIEGRKVQFVDTLYWSMYLHPDRNGHGIEDWGERLGLQKIDWRGKAIELGLIDKNSPKGEEFMQWHPEMDIYCERDVDVNHKVFMALKKEHETFYGDWVNDMPQHFKAGQKSFFLMSCQEYAGWKFDVEAANKLKDRIQVMMEEIRAEVEPKLPPRALKKSEEKMYTMPAKPYKKDGSYSASWNSFVEKHSGVDCGDGLWEFYGKKYSVTAGQMLDIKMPMEMANQDQMKDWFLENNWSPTLWNFQRGPDGKPVRDPKTRKLIQTSPKIQEAGKICPNLLKLEGDIVKQVVKWLSLRNRQSVLEGWLTNERISYDGRLGAGRTGIAATHRQKHRTVVNVPKASDKVLLGKEFRSLWTSEDGMLIAAGDAAALEGRVQGSYTFKYDNGETADELLKGDPHSKNAMAFFGHMKELESFDITSPDFNKDDPVFKPFRDRSKNGFYAILYGAAGPKVASTLGLPEKMGQSLMEKFWEANPGTKELKDKLEKYWETRGQEKYLPAIDGRILHTRKKSALLNTIFQSCGGIAMDYACCFLDSWLGDIHWDEKRRPYYLYKGCVVRRIGYMHDEVEFECEAPVAEEVGKLIEKAIEKAGQFLKIQVPLAGEAKVGKNWKEVH